MDAYMEDADPPTGIATSDMDMNMDDAGAFTSNRNIIHIDSDDDDESDGTLLGDEIVERTTPLSFEAGRRRRQVRAPAISFRELQTHTQNGRTFQVGRSFQDQEGNFLRVISIKQYWRSGRIIIESFRDNSHKVLQTCSYNGRTLKPGKTVEMVDGTFLRIKAIVEDPGTGEIFLKGFRLQRALTLNGLLERNRNEVALILKLDETDRRDMLDQSIEVVKLAAVVKIRDLVRTNQQFPALSYRTTDPESIRLGKDYIVNHSRLVCRWIYLMVSKNEGFLRRITDDESDDGCSVLQDQLRYDYRGPTTKGGDSPGWLDIEEAFDRKERMRCRFIDPLGFHYRPIDMPRRGGRRQTYTFGDAFCGCGGASRGAHGAGLRVAWGFDQDSHAIATYHANFPYARCEGIAVNDFITALNEDYKVDVLHLSPPCQTFSPAKTRVGPNDESNEASFLAIDELLKKTRPRIVTLEETFGLTRTGDRLPWFNAMIQSLTKFGFSVRWKVFNLQDFGLPQPRKRLFLFASCPGETLPDFPKPTHCRQEDLHLFPNLPKYNTVNDAIGRIPRNFPNHSPHLMARLRKPAFSSNRPLRNTITCSGSINYHPSGTRCFTVRELACLQGFPLEHRFGRGERKQIGNAVPPIIAKVFFEQVVRALRTADGL